MRIIIIFCLLSLFLMQTYASPTKLLERQKQSVARQGSLAPSSGGIAPGPAVGTAVDEDEDDDDDDDDDPDLGDLVDDDDDDDDEDDDAEDDDDDTPQGLQAPGAATASDDDEEDDDDDDYLDRLFDDILGDDEDDDDDDTDIRPVSSPVNPISSVVPEEIASPAAQTATIVSGIADGVDQPADIANSADLPVGNTAQNEIQGTGATANAVTSNVVNNEGTLAGDDDDEEADDDDDDDDDIIGDDVIEARREARAVKNNIIEMTRDAFQDRQNRFIDSIFSRINRIVSETFDPLVVRLGGHSSSAKSDISTKSENTSQKTHNNKAEHTTNKKLKSDIKKQEQKTIGNSKLMKPQANQDSPIENLDEEMRTAVGNVVLDGVDDNLPRKQLTNSSRYTNKSETKKNKSSKKTSGTKNKSSSNSSNQEGNGKQLEKLEKTEASLSGLDSLKRVGNVKVVSDAEGRNSTIKAKFTLGPLLLRVEKSFKRGSVRSVKSATARTNQMIGRIKFSVANERATLMSIKVQQPKQVEVESKGNNDHRRDFVWRRSPEIAKLVNERLKIAAETIFLTDGVENVNL